MELWRFAAFCGAWALAFLAVKAVYWFLGLGKDDLKVISRRFAKAGAHVKKTSSGFREPSRMGFRRIARQMRRVDRVSRRAERRLRLSVFDNPDNKAVDAMRQKVISMKKELFLRANAIVGSAQSEGRKFCGRGELDEISACLDLFATACEEISRAARSEMEKSRIAASLKF